jgi:hypothetical protein
MTTRRRLIDDFARLFRWLLLHGATPSGRAAFWRNWHEFWNDYGD